MESNMTRVGRKELITALRRFQGRKAYAALKRACGTAVKEWRWATSLMLPELPHDDIVRGFKPPRWAKKRPRRGSLHGLDAEGRVRYIRSDDRTRPDEEVYEQLLIHEDNGFWCVYFDDQAGKTVLQVKWFEFQGGKWLRSLEIGHRGVREQVLHWEADRLVTYRDRFWSGASARAPRAAAASKLKGEGQTVYTYAYADDGELERVTEQAELGDSDPPRPEVKYQRVPRGVSLNSLLRRAEDLLVAEIPKTIRAARVRQRVYALLLQYTGVDTDPCGYAPPMFLAPEGLRRRLLAEHPGDPAWALWAVPEWESDPAVVRVTCEDAALDETLRLIFQLTVVRASPTNYGPVRKMFQRVCARLNAFDWKGTLKTTDDFVAVPFDTHGEMDTKADLKACVPAERLCLLMDRGFVGRMRFKGRPRRTRGRS
jgi:hypothetical protein